MARRRNLQGVERGCLGTIFLGPGMILQWFLYMFPAKGKARSNARIARSPLMTWVFSLAFWGVVGFLGLLVILTIIDPHLEQVAPDKTGTGTAEQHISEEMSTSGSADAGGAIEDSTDSVTEEEDF